MSMTVSEKREVCLKEYEEHRSFIDSRCEADIEKYRKGEMRIYIKDRNGKAVKGKKISIHQKTHDFKYGANIFMLDEFAEESDNRAYREMFSKYFNLATVPFYWDGLEPEKGKPRFTSDSPKLSRRPAPDLCADYCKQSGILPKLHCLFYDKFIPDWLPLSDEKQMRRLYEKRFSEIAERYSGRMYEFEVTNETLCAPGWNKKSVLSDKRGNIEWAFELARKYFKNDKLVINEGNPIPSIIHDGYTAKYFLQLEMLLEKGTPIDKIGLQHHIFSGASLPAGSEADDKDIKSDAKRMMNFSGILNSLDKLAEFGLPLEITEITLPTLGVGDEAEELQAAILEILYKIWFSHPNMESVAYWNTVDYTAYIGDGSWNENNCRGGLFHRDFTPKKSALKLYELFNKIWHTDISAVSDENGEAVFRGFWGDYEAETYGKKYSFGLHKNSDNFTEIII